MRQKLKMTLITIPLDLDEKTDENENDNNLENNNGLENFELGNESPQLFNTDNNFIDEDNQENSRKDTEEDELEIPAFLRRQKN